MYDTIEFNRIVFIDTRIGMCVDRGRDRNRLVEREKLFYFWKMQWIKGSRLFS